MKEDLLKIIKFYGPLNQLKYIQTEYFELDEAIFDYEYGENHNGDLLRKHIAEELADVYVMLEQFRVYYGINSGEVGEIMNKKITRQIERIKNEQEQL